MNISNIINMMTYYTIVIKNTSIYNKTINIIINYLIIVKNTYQFNNKIFNTMGFVSISSILIMSLIILLINTISTVKTIGNTVVDMDIVVLREIAKKMGIKNCNKFKNIDKLQKRIGQFDNTRKSIRLSYITN